jgi:uracil-DNA glycosylase
MDLRGVRERAWTARGSAGGGESIAIGVSETPSMSTVVPGSGLPRDALRRVMEGSLDARGLAAAAASCTACDLWARATQTVFGEGPIPADVMLVGEQPGDQEDRSGRPFVGPAGRILDEALEAAGIDRERVFVTNVVKHFKWRPVPGSKRRLHERPDRSETGACLPWVESELRLVAPKVLVLLGATSAAALIGAEVRVTRDHGRPLSSGLAPTVMATIHPSAVLRTRGATARTAAFEGLVDDLRLVSEWLPPKGR